MKESPNFRRLEALFPRYWDSALSAPELAEFEAILRSDPEARQCFLMLSMQGAAAADPPAGTRLPPPAAASAGWSRRRLLAYAGGGLALGVAGLAGGLAWGPLRSPDHAIHLKVVRGVVRLNDGAATAGMRLPLEAVVRSVGPSSSAVLTLACGTTVCLTGDSTLSLRAGGRLTLLKGTATANVRPAGERGQLTLATSAASVVSPDSASVTVGSGVRTTEVGVQTGHVLVSDRAGALVGEVREGEILTVRNGGKATKQPLPPTPDSFRWDLTRPLPEGWAVGDRVMAHGRMAVRPEFWYDPYHSAELWQARSDNQWTRGFVRLFPDSVIRVRYWVDRPGPGQVVFCVRTALPNVPASGVVEVNDAFVNSRPGEWQWLEARPSDMLDNKEAPAFGPPWVGFLIILNTFAADLGLRVADLRVSRGGGDRPG